MKLFGPPSGRETLPRYLFKYMPQFVISSISGILYNTVIVLGPILLGRLIDAAGGGAGQQVLLSALYFAGVTAFFQFARFVKRWYMRDQFNRVACDLRSTFLERMLGRPLPDLEKETVGDLMSRTVSDITLVVDTVMSTINEGWDTFLLMLSYFVALMLQDWKITLLASTMVPLTILLAHSMRNVLYKFSLEARKAASASNSGLQRYLEAAAVLRLFGREQSEAEGIRRSFERQTVFNVRQMLLQQAMLPVYALLAGLGVVLTIGMGGTLVAKGAWTVGTLNAYLVMFIAFTGRTQVAARVFNQWHAARAAWGRVKEKLDIKTTLPLEAAAPAPPLETLAVRDLTFGFGEAEVLHGISFTAKKGQIIGVTGPVGSGKTALAHALLGMYPYSGSVMLDETELSSITKDLRGRFIAYTGHEQFLFSMSIRDNIQFSDKNDEMLDLALETAALKNDIARFDKGLDTPVGERGVRVSGGQRQRIAMARAVFADAPLLLLDDPFSAVDIATETRMVESLRRLCRDRIVLVFSHRLTAFPQVDEILVLEKGSITQRGSHEALMQEQGLYKDIYNAQLFLEESNADTQMLFEKRARANGKTNAVKDRPASFVRGGGRVHQRLAFADPKAHCRRAFGIRRAGVVELRVPLPRCGGAHRSQRPCPAILLHGIRAERASEHPHADADPPSLPANLAFPSNPVR
jgi:ABC-type multidrug transport system fused ATPase/permease subunit